MTLTMTMSLTKTKYKKFETLILKIIWRLNQFPKSGNLDWVLPCRQQATQDAGNCFQIAKLLFTIN